MVPRQALGQVRRQDGGMSWRSTSAPTTPGAPWSAWTRRPRELHSTPGGSLPPEPKSGGRPGKARREDYEYARHGTRNLFLWVEPLTGRRGVCVTARRTGLDFAHQLKSLVDAYPLKSLVDAYPEAERVVLVTDNLNTHAPHWLYEAFAPEEARRVAARVEWHYTPEHGSWLNMAETELSVLSLPGPEPAHRGRRGACAGGGGLAGAAGPRPDGDPLAVHRRGRPDQAAEALPAVNESSLNLTLVSQKPS